VKLPLIIPTFPSVPAFADALGQRDFKPHLVGVVYDLTWPKSASKTKITLATRIASHLSSRERCDAELCQAHEHQTKRNPALAAVRGQMALLPRYDVPTYYVSRELLAASLRTELPDDMVFAAISFPFDGSTDPFPQWLSNRAASHTSTEMLHFVVLNPHRYGRTRVRKLDSYRRIVFELQFELGAVLQDCFDLASPRKDVCNPGCLHLRGRFIGEPDNKLFGFSEQRLNQESIQFDGQSSAVKQRRRNHPGDFPFSVVAALNANYAAKVKLHDFIFFAARDEQGDEFAEKR